jgi:hypothetical protein
MQLILLVTTFHESKFVPVAVGLFGLGMGYFVWGGKTFFGFPPDDPDDPARNREINRSIGLWGIWMPGFMQFITGVYLWIGLTWFSGVFTEKPLYMAALAFTAYGVHWFVLGHKRYIGSDPRPDAWMAIAFSVLSVLGVFVFADANDYPVMILFIGLSLIYLTEVPTRFTGSAGLERLYGLWQLLTGAWLMYLVVGFVGEIALERNWLF